MSIIIDDKPAPYSTRLPHGLPIPYGSVVVSLQHDFCKSVIAYSTWLRFDLEIIRSLDAEESLRDLNSLAEADRKTHDKYRERLQQRLYYWRDHVFSAVDACLRKEYKTRSLLAIDRELLEQFSLIFRDFEESLQECFPRPRESLSDGILPSATELDLLIGCCAPLWELRFPIDERTLQDHLLRFSISKVPHGENEPTGIPRMITFGLHRNVIFWSLTAPVWSSDVFPKSYFEEERYNNIPAKAG